MEHARRALSKRDRFWIWPQIVDKIICNAAQSATRFFYLHFLVKKWQLRVFGAFLEFFRFHEMTSRAGLPVFSWTQYTKMVKKLPNYHNITKWPQNISHGRKIFQMTIKYTNIFNSKALQNLPKLEFLVIKYTIWQPWSRDCFALSSMKDITHVQQVSA
jgi:hypothetical protein